MKSFVEKASPLSATLNLQEVLGRRVLAKSGAVLGRVKTVQVSKSKYCVEGIVVRKIFTEDTYIGISYIAAITSQAVMLSIEPATLYEGRKVVTRDGKLLGTVKKVHRFEDTNRIASLTVNYGWFRTMRVRYTDIEHLGSSIILSKKQEQLKRDRKSRN